MKAFVTGGTGIVGRTFLPRLLAAGWDVTALTRDPSKPDLPRHERIIYVAGDLSDGASVERLLKTPAEFDAVVHLAASLDYFGPVGELLAVNAKGTETMTRYARHVGARRFVYASSIEAAGAFKSSEIPAGPERTGRPLTGYGISKIAAERHTLELNRDGIPSVCLRIGNVYGPGWANFIVGFAQSIQNRGMLWEYLPIYGDRYWSPIWNDDVSDGIVTAVTGAATGVENLVGEAATVEEMFRFCAEAMGVPFTGGRRKLGDWAYVGLPSLLGRGGRGEFAYLMAPTWPRIHRCFSMGESAKRLGWQPKMRLRAGVRETLIWARANKLVDF